MGHSMAKVTRGEDVHKINIIVFAALYGLETWFWF